MSRPTLFDSLKWLIFGPFETYNFETSVGIFSDASFNSFAVLNGFAQNAECKWWEPGSDFRRMLRDEEFVKLNAVKGTVVSVTPTEAKVLEANGFGRRLGYDEIVRLLDIHYSGEEP